LLIDGYIDVGCLIGAFVSKIRFNAALLDWSMTVSEELAVSTTFVTLGTIVKEYMKDLMVIIDDDLRRGS
jgi:hypothetical protein